MILTGTAWKFPQDNISTDLIRAKMYSHLSFAEQGQHCLEDIDPTFPARVKPGDFIVAARNFGSGSSTAAHGAVIGAGVAAVIAESFGRLFLSNCLSAGLWAVTCSGIVGAVESGETLELDIDRWQVRSLATGRTLAVQPLPDFFRDMVVLGGEKAYLRARIAKARGVQSAA
jgi:3-isopropylmalate/(R)-2-methylmalate dehydratase small subunit